MPKMALQKREQVMLVVGSLIVALSLAYVLGRGPIERYRNTNLAVVAARDNLEQARARAQAVIEARAREAALEEKMRASPGGTDLYSLINSTISRQGLTDKHFSLKTTPRAAMRNAEMAAVTVTLNGVNMENIVNVLHGVYSGGGIVALHSLTHLRPAINSEGLDCELTFLAPRR